MSPSIPQSRIHSTWRSNPSPSNDCMPLRVDKLHLRVLRAAVLSPLHFCLHQFYNTLPAPDRCYIDTHQAHQCLKHSTLPVAQAADPKGPSTAWIQSHRVAVDEHVRPDLKAAVKRQASFGHMFLRRSYLPGPRLPGAGRPAHCWHLIV
jgi:hypothetical protein